MQELEVKTAKHQVIRLEDSGKEQTKRAMMQMKTQLEGRKGSKVTMENAKDSKR